MNRELINKIIENNTSNSDQIAVKLFIATFKLNMSLLDNETCTTFLLNMTNEENVLMWMKLHGLFTGSATGKTNITNIASKLIDAFMTTAQ